jgi:hypothetical protein
MVELVLRSLVLAAGAALWLAGLRLFLRAGLSRARRLVWSAGLIAVGGLIGLLLSGSQLEQRFGTVLVLLPVLAAVDVRLLRSGRGLSFWIRACGFELGTVFGVAGLTRLLCDQAGLRALLGGG